VPAQAVAAEPGQDSADAVWLAAREVQFEAWKLKANDARNGAIVLTEGLARVHGSQQLEVEIACKSGRQNGAGRIWL